MPLRWSQVTRRLDPTRFTIATALRRLERDGDPMVELFDHAVDVPALEPGARSVRDELHHAVDRNRDERVVEEQHHGQQRDATGHPDDCGEDRSEERGDRQDGELGGIQAQLCFDWRAASHSRSALTASTSGRRRVAAVGVSTLPTRKVVESPARKRKASSSVWSSPT